MIEEDIVTYFIDGEDYPIVYDNEVKAQSGYLYKVSGDSIFLEDARANLNFKLLNKELLHHAKAFVAYSLKRRAEVTVVNRYNAIKYNLNLVNTKNTTEIIKEKYREIVQDESITPETKSVLRSFYRFCCDEGMPYFDESFYDYYLDEIEFGTNKGKGIDVLIPMKDRGPLTVKENRLFNKRIKEIDYKSLPFVTLQGFVSLRIAQMLGARDIQVRNLLVKNFQENNGIYSINMPRAKQRGQRKKRKSKARFITKELGEQIEYLISSMKKYTENDISSYPLLSTFESGSNVRITDKKLSEDAFRRRIVSICQHLNLGFKVTNRRLRKTACSTLIAMGVPLKVVAEIMDHSDLQQLQVYFRQTHEIAAKINHVFLEEFNDVLDAFKGKIISKGEESYPGQQIFAETINSKLYEIGSCGSGNLCNLNPPISCYGCSAAELFEDADHKKVLESFTQQAKDIFGESHIVKLLEDDNYLALSAVINVIESGDYE